MLQHVKLTLFCLCLFFFSLEAESLLFEQNVYISKPISVKNEINADQLAKEKAEKESRRAGRRFSHYLDGESHEGFSVWSDPKTLLFVNTHWKSEIILEGTKPGSKIEVSLNQGSVFNYESPFSINEPGLNEIRYRSVDPLQNEEAWRSLRLFRDDLGPVLSYTISGSYIPTLGGYFIGKDAELRIQAEDLGSGVLHRFYKIGEGEWTLAKDGAVDLSRIQSKSFIFLSALDKVYNRAQATQISLQKVTEIGIPKIEVSKANQDASGTYCSRLTRFWFQKLEHPVPFSVFYKSSGQTDFSPYTKGLTELDEQKEGETISIEYFSQDGLGNQSPVHKWSCKFDSTPPQTDIKYTIEKQ
jgi:hypothetical protein